MKKSENIQITEFDKKANVHNMELLPVVCLPVYKEIVKEMAELIEDKQAREVFCSLSSGRDLQSVSQIQAFRPRTWYPCIKGGFDRSI